MIIKKLVLSVASDFLRYIQNTLLASQYKQKNSDIPVTPIVTRAKNLTTRQNPMLVTYDTGDTNG